MEVDAQTVSTLTREENGRQHPETMVTVLGTCKIKAAGGAVEDAVQTPPRTALAKFISEYHSGAVPECSGCRKSFATVSARNLHVRPRYGGGRYPCQGCDKVFNRKCHLSQHIKSVHQTPRQKSHQCHDCGKTFTRKQGVKKHMKVHNKAWRRVPFCEKIDVTLIKHVRKL